MQQTCKIVCTEVFLKLVIIVCTVIFVEFCISSVISADSLSEESLRDPTTYPLLMKHHDALSSELDNNKTLLEKLKNEGFYFCYTVCV